MRFQTLQSTTVRWPNSWPARRSKLTFSEIQPRLELTEKRYIAVSWNVTCQDCAKCFAVATCLIWRELGPDKIDVIVTAGTTPRFEMGSGNQAIAPLEGTVAVAEVKSNLNKTTLYEALDSFSELPVSAEPGRALNPSVKPPPLERFWDFPFKIVFASSGVGKTTLSRHLDNYYIDNPNIPQECRPSIIHVLGKFVLVRVSQDMQARESDGSVAKNQTQVGDYRWFDTQSDLSAMLFVFSRLQSNAFLAQQMIWKYDNMINPIIWEAQKLPAT